MRKVLRGTALLSLSFHGLVVGCATVDPRNDYDRVDRQVETLTGQRLTYRPGDEPAVRSRTALLLEGGLTADEAVQLALLNNPLVWAGLLRTGMARADVVQAGLFSNPTVGVSLRFPEGGGLADLESGLAQNIAELWAIPARTRAAERDLDRAILDTAREAANLAHDTRVAYYNAVAAKRALEISHENLGLVQELLRITEARLEAGAVGSLDVSLVRGLALHARVDERAARLTASTAQRALATLVGVTAPAEDLHLVDPLPAPTWTAIDAETLAETAGESRIELRAARDAVLAAEARVELECAKVLGGVELGFDLEREARRAPPARKLLADTARASIADGGLATPEIESRGQRRRAAGERIEAILGPSLSVTLPIFDRNQAQIAKARLAMQEADARLASLQRAIVQEAREAADRAATACEIARTYELEVLPQARTTLELSQSAYQAGQTHILNVIDAQRSLLETRRAYVAALQNAATALVELERAVGRPIVAQLHAGGAATRPAHLPAAPDCESPPMEANR